MRVHIAGDETVERKLCERSTRPSYFPFWTGVLLGDLVPAPAAPLGTARKCAAPCDTDHLWHSGRLVRCTPGVGALGRRPPTRGDGPHGCAHCAGCSMDRFPGSRCTPQCGQAKELGSLSLSVGGPPATASSSLANWL